MSESSRFTVAVHALCWLELARRRGAASLTSEAVAASLLANPALLRRTLGELRRAGMLEAERGRAGGWSLAAAAEDITLERIRDAVDARPRFGLHAHEPNQSCPVGFGVTPVLSELFRDVDDAVSRVLDRRTVADVLDAALAESAAAGVS
jgi:Rrf2 family protein